MISRWGAGRCWLFEPGQPPRTIHCPGGDGYLGELRYLIECLQN